MIFRSTPKQEQEYRQHPAISQSSLKLILKGIHLFNSSNDENDEKYYEEKEHFIIGTAVDDLITMGKDICEKKYYISTIKKKPTATIMSIVKEIYDSEFHANPKQVTEEYFKSESLKESIISIAQSQGYQSNWKPETKYTKVITLGKEYWDDLVASQGRFILSQDQFKLIKKIYTNILSHQHTSHLFKDDNYTDIYFQLPLFFKHNFIECKALLDMCTVNHKDRTIQPFDIKTMGDYTMNFPKSLFRRRYDIQAAFYTLALQISDFKVKRNLENYTILPFKFIVESSISPGTPLVFKCAEDVLNRGKFGLRESQCGDHWFNKITGFEHGIRLYKWYLENGFSEERVIVENEGELLLSNKGIVYK